MYTHIHTYIYFFHAYREANAVFICMVSVINKTVSGSQKSLAVA